MSPAFSRRAVRTFCGVKGSDLIERRFSVSCARRVRDYVGSPHHTVLTKQLHWLLRPFVHLKSLTSNP